MNQSAELEATIKALSEAKSGAIFIPQEPNLDQVAASLSLFLSLQKAGKSLSLVCASPMTVEFSRLVGVNKISNQVGGRSLVVSFEYQENAIDKVSYNIENNKFNLIIQPKSGFSPLSSEKVDYRYSGDLELLIVMGAARLTDLGPVYEKEKQAFEKGSVLNLDIGSDNSRFGQINAVFSLSSSYSEVVALILAKGNYTIDRDIANNLLMGLQQATTNFSSPRVSAEAFEAAAFCLRAGGRFPSRFPQASRRPPLETQGPLKAMSQAASADRSPEEDKNQTDDNQDLPQTGKTPHQKPPDWFGPKVFRGSTRV